MRSEVSSFYLDNGVVVSSFFSTFAEPDNKPQVGDVVTLKTGGPPMTVLDVCDDCGEVEVSWFNWSDTSDEWVTYGDLQIASFPAIALVKVATN